MLIHNMPEQLTEAEKSDGVLVETFTEPKSIESKISLPHYLYNTKEIVNDYMNIHKTPEQLNQEALLKQNADLTARLETIEIAYSGSKCV